RNTLPVWLYRAGYNTIFLGKYINGYGRQKTRNGTPSRNYIPPGWTEWRASLDGRGTYNYFNTHLKRNNHGEQSLTGQYQTNAHGRIGKYSIRRSAKRSRQFSLNIWCSAPHHGRPQEPADSGVRSPARAPRTVGDINGSTRRLPVPTGE